MSLEGHSVLESEAPHLGLQLTPVHTSGASSHIILQEPRFVAVVTFSIVCQNYGILKHSLAVRLWTSIYRF